jgi:nitroreductase
MDVIEAIRTRRVVRQFKPLPLPEEAVEKILNAGRRAPSAKNMQPWSFIAITNRQTLQALSQLGVYAGHLAGAALGIAILTPPPEMRWSVLFDAGQAAAYLQLAAWDLGIGSCPATIYEPEKARQFLGYPPDQHLHVVLSFGYPQDESLLTAPPRKGARRSFANTVHWQKWGNQR